jgi:hypothetical protein
MHALLLALLFAPPSPASSARTDELAAESLIVRGVELRKAGRHEEALELFVKAHGLAPSGRSWAQMGLAEFSLKRYVDAETHLSAALAASSPWVDAPMHRSALEQALAGVRTHIAVINVAGPAGAEVTMNGKPVGRLPLPEPIHVAEGPLRVEATALGHQPWTLDVTVAGGRDFNVTVSLVPISPPPLPVVTPPPVPEPPPEPSTSNWKRWTGVGLLALSAGVLTTGIVWLVVADSGTCDPPAGARCLNVYDTRAQGFIALGVGIASAAAGGLLVWQSRQADLRVGLAPGALTASGRF